MRNKILVIGLLVLTILSTGHASFAQNSESGKFRLEFATPNFEDDSVRALYDISNLWGGYAAQKLANQGYVVKVGQQAANPLRFLIKDVDVELPQIAPVTSNIRYTELRVSYPRPAHVMLSAVDDLKSIDGERIQPTSCDKSDPCTDIQAGSWKRNDSFGFGYNVRGSGSSSPEDAWKAFGREPREIALTHGNDEEALTVSFKVTTNPTQPAKTYQAVINALAVPSF